MSVESKEKKAMFPLKGKMPLMIGLLIVGVLMLVVGSLIPGEGQEVGVNDKPTEPEIQQNEELESDPTTTEEILEARLTSILSEIRGSGEVSVALTLKTGSEYKYAKNVTEDEREVSEVDTDGGERITTETTGDREVVLVQNEGMGEEEPVIKMETKPQIRGVLVVAEGASDPSVKAELTDAVRTMLGIPAHLVSVVTMESER